MILHFDADAFFASAECARASVTSIRDFCERVRLERPEALNLIRCGAFDSLGGTGTEHFWHVTHCSRDTASGADWLFKGSGEDAIRAARGAGAGLHRLVLEDRELSHDTFIPAL